MGEIDTTSIESVQAAISLFGEKIEQMKNKPTTTSNDASHVLDKEKEFENLMKDLANLKVQMEAKESAHKQALLELDHYQKTADELSILLKNSEIENDIIRNDCKESGIRVSELESMIEKMANQLPECVKLREQLSHAISELKDAQGELLHLDVQLSAAKDAKFESMTRVQVLEYSLSLEKLKTEELLRHIRELNETIMHLKMIAAEKEKEKIGIITENEVKELDKCSFIDDSVQQDLIHPNALHKSSEKVAFDGLSELNQLKEEKKSDQAGCISFLEAELKELKLELRKGNEEKQRLIRNAEELREELEKTRSEIDEARENENAAKVEIALLKSELHKGRSKVVAAEASEQRAKTEKSAVYAALEQLAIEAEEAKKEYRHLKAASSNLAEKSESPLSVKIQCEGSIQSTEDADIKSNTGKVEGAQVTILKEEYEILVRKAEQTDKVQNPEQENATEAEDLKKELEIATTKVAEFRTRAEQAISRAQIAERGKAELEEQIKKWKDHKAKRKAALSALHEVSVSKETSEASVSKEIDPYRNNDAPKFYQPLGKVLNMKF